MVGKKLDKKEIGAIGALIVAGVQVANELWREANHDGRMSKAAQGLGERLQRTLAVRDPVARLGGQLDIIEQAARQVGEDSAHHDQSEGWLRTAALIRAKLPVVAVEKGRTRKAHLTDLKKRTAALLSEIVTHGLDEEADPAE